MYIQRNVILANVAKASEEIITLYVFRKIVEEMVSKRVAVDIKVHLSKSSVGDAYDVFTRTTEPQIAMFLREGLKRFFDPNLVTIVDVKRKANSANYTVYVKSTAVIQAPNLQWSY